VVDLSTPAKPRIVGTYKTPSPARDVVVSDSHVFVVTSADSALTAFELIDPAIPPIQNELSRLHKERCRPLPAL
jgi:hypothetical protein